MNRESLPIHRWSFSVVWLQAIGLMSCAAILSGCSPVELATLPDSKYLDRSEYFVGTVTIQGKNKDGVALSSTILFGSPESDGRRELFQTVRLVDDSKTQESNKGKGKQGDLLNRFSYLYNIDGIRYHFFVQKQENQADRYTPVRVAYRKRKLTFEIPDFSKFKEHWPLSPVKVEIKNKAGSTTHSKTVFDGSPTEIAEVLGDRELSDQLFEGCFTYLVDANQNSIVYINGEGKVVDEGDEINEARIAMLLPGNLTRNAVLTLVVAAIAATIFISVVMTGKLLLDNRLVGSAGLDFDPTISKRVLVFGSLSALLVGSCILVISVVFSGSFESLNLASFLPAVFLFTVSSVVALWVIERFGDWIWSEIVGYRLSSTASNDELIGAVVAADRDILRLGVLVGFLVGLCVLIGCSIGTVSSESWAWRVVVLVLAAGIVAGSVATWLTIQNEPLVRLVNSALRAETVRRAIGPCVIAFIMILPGFVLNHWVNKKVMSWVDKGLSHQVDVVMPGVSLKRPIVREPTIEDGFFVFLLGVPQVEFVEWSTNEQRFNMRTPSPWREAVLSFLKLLGAIATCVLLLLMARLFVSIFLRVAATSSDVPVTYRPIL